MGPKVSVELGPDVDGWGFAGGVLNHEEQLRYDLDNVPGLHRKSLSLIFILLGITAKRGWKEFFWSLIVFFFL